MSGDPSGWGPEWLSGMSQLQREVERRKTDYLECIVRRAFLKRGGWDDPLVADIKREHADDKKRQEELVKARWEHLDDDLIHRHSVCDARGWCVPPPNDRDLVQSGDRIRRFDAAIAGGMNIDAAKRAFGDLTVKPLGWDGQKHEGLARLDLARRCPERRAALFGWNPASKEPKERNADNYWSALPAESFDHLRLMWDTADFHANDFVRLIYLYGDVPPLLRSRAGLWRPRDRLDRDPDFSGAVEARMLTALREFKYWIDEQPRAVSCGDLQAARKKHPRDEKKSDDELKYEMTFWSENHQILFPAAEYLAGQWMPDAPFMPGREFRADGKDPKRGDYTGAERMERAKPRVRRWLDDRLRFGFSEWNAPGYYKEHLQALFNLADFCLDDELRTRTHMVIDLLFFDVARFTLKGQFGATAGRAYFEHKNCGWEQGVSELAEMLFGVHDGIYTAGDTSPAFFASSRAYRVPDAIVAIGRDADARTIDRTRVSIGFDDAAEHGIGTHDEADMMRWWSRGAWFCKQVVERSRELAEHYGLDKTDPFAQVLGMTGMADSKLAYGIAGLATLLSPPIGVSMLALLEIIDEEEMANLASLITEGSALTRANLYTWRDPHAMLSSVQDFRAGQYNFQMQTCQATLSMGATVWTSHPSAGSDLSAFKGFLEVVGAGAGGIGGFILGSALGNLVSVLVPAAPLALGVVGAWKGGVAGEGVGSSIGDVKLIKVNHDGPNWWTGSVTLPRVVQVKNAAIIAYAPHTFQRMLFGNRTHAWFPKDAFDPNADADDRAGMEQAGPTSGVPTPMPRIDTNLTTPIIASLTPVPSVHCNVDGGAWVFGRVGDGYVALFSGQKPRWTTSGDWAGKELLAEGDRNVFILQVGSRDEFGSYIAFKRRVLSARIHINGLHWSPADFQCSYDIPGGSRLELHIDENKVRYGGLDFADCGFPRIADAYAQIAWQQSRYAIQHRGHSLVHDVANAERRMGGELRSLRHDVNLRIYWQNTGLFPTDLLGLPITGFPLYKGTERERALRALIAVLRNGAFDVVGLCEMWHRPDRERIVRELRSLYPHHLEGPDEADLERFDGGLLLLSKHRIVESNQTVFRQAVGEDGFANKGALHARILPTGHACAIDVFVTHTQGPAPTIGKVADARRAIRDQLRHLAAFVHACRDARAPALLAGDLNVDALHMPDEYAFLTAQLNGPTPGLEEAADDLHPRSARAAVHTDATSENEDARVSSFNDGNAPRASGDAARFGERGERIDYLFSWPGSVFRPDYPIGDRRVVLHQSSTGRDLSDHYGIEARLATIDQRLIGRPGTPAGMRVRMTRFWCLDTTSGPGDDEVRFELRVLTARGVERSARSAEFDDVDAGTERAIDAPVLDAGDPGEFLVVAVGGQELDDWSADDSLGWSSRWLDAHELSFHTGKRVRFVLPRLRGDGGEYAVEVELDAG